MTCKIFIIAVTLLCASGDNFAKNTLHKLTDILSAMDVKGMIEQHTGNIVSEHFYKYYSDDLLPLQFALWKEHHGKQYGSEDEHTARHQIWSKNVRWIHEHNKDNKTYTVAMNHLGDLTAEEYKGLLGMDVQAKIPVGLRVPTIPNLPASHDWRKEGYVTAVKNQGQCGSCWSFSSTGAMEGLGKKRTGKLVSLSEQDLVDCSTSYGNYGCNGGLMDNAFQFVIDIGGIESEEAYPYEGVEGTCRYNRNETVLKLTGFTDIPAGSERAMQGALANNGPVSIAIDAAHQSFQFYKSGVYDEMECSPTQLDHGVLAVGYDTDAEGGDYWIVKNSWSEAWGQDGYIWMSRNKNNQCGVSSSASFPL